MARAEARQFFSGYRFLVRVRGRAGTTTPWRVLPVAKLQSVEGGLLVSSGAGPEHPLLRALVEVSSTEYTAGMGPSRSRFGEIELWRVANGTPDRPAVLVRESYEFESYVVRAFDLDATRSGAPLEHALLRGLRRLESATYEAAKLPEDVPAEARTLARWVLSEIPQEPGDYRVYFRQDDGEFTLEGSEGLFRLETATPEGGEPRYRAQVFLGSVELPATGNRRLDVLQRRGGQDHDDAVLVVEGDVREQVVAEALYLARVRTGRVIESVIRAA